jgi:nitrite reductase (NADH) small subunit
VEFARVARLGELPLNRGRLVRLGGCDISVWRLPQGVYAIENVCPHQHFSMLHQGSLSGIELSCPMHGWTFALDTGKNVNGSGRLRRFGVRVNGGIVEVEVPGEAW